MEAEAKCKPNASNADWSSTDLKRTPLDSKCLPEAEVTGVSAMNATKTSVVPTPIELYSLAAVIEQHHAEASILAKDAKSKAFDAIKSALLCGQALNKAKGMVPHGQWLRWLGENCKDIEDRTAQKYMRLANTNHGSHLTEATSLRQAYQLAGIIPETEKPQPKELTAPQTTEAEPAKPNIVRKALETCLAAVDGQPGCPPDIPSQLRTWIEELQNA